MIATHNTFWEQPVSIFRNIKTLIYLKKQAVSETLCAVTMDILPNVCDKTRKWLGSNSNSHVTFFDKNLVF
jgi:hypothetical protein